MKRTPRSPQQNQLLYDAPAPVIGADKVTYTLLQGAGHCGSQFTVVANMKVVVLDFLERSLKG